MAEGRSKQMWTHTSCIMALIANVNRDPKKTRAFKPDDFNPYAQVEVRQSPQKGWAMLKEIFGKNHADSR